MHNYEIIYSRRKSIAIQITRDLKIIVRAPLHTPEKAIRKFVAEHEKWVEEALIRCEKSKAYRKYTPDEENMLREKAKRLLPERVSYFSKQMGLIPCGVKITSARGRFGSCSRKNSLCFSWRLMDYPDKAVDYVVVHELAHIRYKNHSKDFYHTIGQYLPDYKEREKLLKKL